jgi:hypothetical protein
MHDSACPNAPRRKNAILYCRKFTDNIDLPEAQDILLQVIQGVGQLMRDGWPEPEKRYRSIVEIRTNTGGERASNPCPWLQRETSEAFAPVSPLNHPDLCTDLCTAVLSDGGNSEAFPREFVTIPTIIARSAARVLKDYARVCSSNRLPPGNADLWKESDGYLIWV